jgi:hypothetical protein
MEDSRTDKDTDIDSVEYVEEDEFVEGEEEEEEEEDFIDDSDLYGDDMQASFSARAGPKKKKKATTPAGCAPKPSASSASAKKTAVLQGQGLQQKKGRGYLKPAHLVYQRFKWDPKLSRLLDYCHIGYLDRFDGVLETPYLYVLLASSHAHRARKLCRPHSETLTISVALLICMQDLPDDRGGRGRPVPPHPLLQDLGSCRVGS